MNEQERKGMGGVRWADLRGRPNIATYGQLKSVDKKTQREVSRLRQWVIWLTAFQVIQGVAVVLAWMS